MKKKKKKKKQNFTINVHCQTEKNTIIPFMNWLQMPQDWRVTASRRFCFNYWFRVIYLFDKSWKGRKRVDYEATLCVVSALINRPLQFQ